MSWQEPKTLKAAVENGIEKKREQKRKRGCGGVRDVLGSGCEYILGKMDFYRAESYSRWIWTSCSPELVVWKSRGFLGSMAWGMISLRKAAGVS